MISNTTLYSHNLPAWQPEHMDAQVKPNTCVGAQVEFEPARVELHPTYKYFIS